MAYRKDSDLRGTDLTGDQLEAKLEELQQQRSSTFRQFRFDYRPQGVPEQDWMPPDDQRLWRRQIKPPVGDDHYAYHYIERGIPVLPPQGADTDRIETLRSEVDGWITAADDFQCCLALGSRSGYVALQVWTLPAMLMLRQICGTMPPTWEFSFAGDSHPYTFIFRLGLKTKGGDELEQVLPSEARIIPGVYFKGENARVPIPPFKSYRESSPRYRERRSPLSGYRPALLPGSFYRPANVRHVYGPHPFIDRNIVKRELPHAQQIPFRLYYSAYAELAHRKGARPMWPRPLLQAFIYRGYSFTASEKLADGAVRPASELERLLLGM